MKMGLAVDPVSHRLYIDMYLDHYASEDAARTVQVAKMADDAVLRLIGVDSNHSYFRRRPALVLELVVGVGELQVE